MKTMNYEIRHGDSLALLREMPDASVDAIVTDPPYGLEFMGKEWDAPWKQGADVHAEARTRRADEMVDESKRRFIASSVNKYAAGLPFQQWCEAWAAEALRVAKPGAHLVAFGGSRTYHRLACAIEDAGWEVRDCLMWLYGSGFPKSLDVSKAIDKAAGAERPRVLGGQGGTNTILGARKSGEAISGEAIEWQGWGTALKPAHEPIILARKPLSGTVAANVLAHGTGALNVDGCRIGTEIAGWGGGGTKLYDGGLSREGGDARPVAGRWPANVLLDEEAAAALDEQSGERASGFMAAGTEREGIGYHGGLGGTVRNDTYGDGGGASRFFYTAKASAGERHAMGRNTHPTVKPVDLMRWLCRLVTPRGGLVLDPFMGSGSTGVAALSEGFRFLGLEREADYCAMARRRIAGPLFADLE